MLAFTEPRLRDAIGFGGLRRIYETMEEKGMRIHVDLGDVLEGHPGSEHGDCDRLKHIDAVSVHAVAIL